MTKNLAPLKEDKADYAHRFVKSALGAVPYAGTALGELFSVILPPSIELRRDKWMKEVSMRLNELLEKNENLLTDLKENEDFISILLETSQLALKTNREEKIKLYSLALKNSVKIDINFFIQQAYIRYIEELNPYQVLILDFIDKNQNQIIELDSYQKYYNLLTKGLFGLGAILDLSIDSSTVRFFFQDLDKKGLIIVSDAIGELDGSVYEGNYIAYEDQKDLPYIVITEFGKNFLNMIKE